jgi:hypothetical protein
MEIGEIFDVRIGESIRIEDDDVRSLIIDMVRMDIGNIRDKINSAVNELKQKFTELNYSDDELKAEVIYNVTLYREFYFLRVTVAVFPAWCRKAGKEDIVINDKEFRFIDKDYTKERNQQGIKVKQKIKPYEEMFLLMRKLEDMRQKLEKLERECRYEEEEED